MLVAAVVALVVAVGPRLAAAAFVVVVAAVDAIGPLVVDAIAQLVVVAVVERQLVAVAAVLEGPFASQPPRLAVDGAALLVAVVRARLVVAAERGAPRPVAVATDVVEDAVVPQPIIIIYC